MKFYREKFFEGTLRKNYKYTKYVNTNKLTAIISYKTMGEQAIEVEIAFINDGVFHNTKNAAINWSDRYKDFYLKNKGYGSGYTFTKQSWRRLAKMQVFI